MPFGVLSPRHKLKRLSIQTILVCLHCLSAFCPPVTGRRWPAHQSWRYHGLHCLSAFCPPVTLCQNRRPAFRHRGSPLPFGVLSPRHDVLDRGRAALSAAVSIAFRRSVPPSPIQKSSRLLRRTMVSIAFRRSVPPSRRGGRGSRRGPAVVSIAFRRSVPPSPDAILRDIFPGTAVSIAFRRSVPPSRR